jgi:hypothetical protein
MAVVLVAISSAFSLTAISAEDPEPGSSSSRFNVLERFLGSFQLADPDFCWQGDLTLRIDGREQVVRFQLTRHSDTAFDFQAEHPEYALQFVRRDDVTAMVLPRHRKVFWGSGLSDPKDHLESSDLGKRVIRPTSSIAVPVDLLGKLDPHSLFEVLKSTGVLQSSSIPQRWQIGEGTSISFVSLPVPERSLPTVTDRIEIEGKDVRGRIDFSTDVTDAFPREPGAPMEEWFKRHWADFEHQAIDRSELERTIARGARRALEVLVPSDRLTNPTEKNRSVDHGELRWIEGQRVALLHGTPEEIGRAHAALLKPEAMRCIDSVLYGFGLAQTISTGRWFREDLDRAYARLKPFIPERHLVETRALAQALDMDEHLIEVLNVFPELFHCSGFAVFGSATEGGKLYHGRVLDYMTTIGLQDAATTFIIAPTGRIPFVNVGYAGFTGSVSGMNAQRLSLGEMGGRGEGKWDGVPMATLMRRALEECDSLDEVKRLWSENPRTCEYFYVFADGEEQTAVAVAATAESIEFLNPGDSHPLLGEGIQDSVVMSAGSRLAELRKRMIETHGRIDAAASMQLMCRPVAMDSNLHNVLFVPEDGVLYIANASHTQPAADRPYVRLDFLALLKEISTDESRVAAQTNSMPTRDTLSLELDKEDSLDARKCLTDLAWNTGDFVVEIEPPPNPLVDQGCDALVRFPSPIDTGDPINDLAAMEWYRAEVQGGKVQDQLVPAVVVVHESGRGMTVGRLIARGLSKQGVHAFMLQLPAYGVRRSQADSGQAGESMLLTMKQGINDARRAFDAVRVLPGVDPNRVGLQGTSLGGFVVATVSGMDSAYHRSIILLAGGDLYSVLKDGDRDASKTREELKKRGLSLDSVRGILYSIEPLRLAHRVASAKTWLYSGTYDTVVPPACSLKFVEAAGIPSHQHVEMPADHYSGVVFLPGVIRQIADVVSEK